VLTARLFRTHIGWRPRHDAFSARSWRDGDVAGNRGHRFREAKVEHLDGTCAGHLDIGWLEIAMDDAFLVRGLERLGDLPRDLERLGERQWSTRETIRQRGAIDELHHDRVQPLCDFETVNRGDMRMVQRGKQASLPSQPRDALGIVGKLRRQHFDGHLAMESRVECPIHLAHATGIQRPQDAVRAELDSRGQCGYSAVRRQRRECTIGRQRVHRGTLGKRARIGVRREQRFHFIPERDVPAARVAQERRAVVWRTRQRRVKYLFDQRPSTSIVRHDRATRPLVMRRYSHARADCHSRVIVARDNDRTAATSSSESPPKYFNSTMFA
jgi:hypothetical protein